MTTSEEQPTDTVGESTSEWPRFERRPLLKMLGLGTAVSFGSRTAVASGTVHESTETDQSGGIDPTYGRAIPNAEDVGSDVDPDHEVELHVEDPVPGVHGPLFHFSPTGLAVSPGDVVQFTFVTPDHTVTAYHPGHGFQRRVPESVPPFSSPIVNAGGAWLYRFETAGVYDLYCGPHHILGMAMRIVVGDLGPEEIPDYVDAFEGSENPPLLAPFSKERLESELEAFSPEGSNRHSEWAWLTPREVLSADALDPQQIHDAGTVPFEDVFEEILRFSIAENGHYAWFPFGPNSWTRSASPFDIQRRDGRWLAQPTSEGGVRCLVENIGTSPPNRNAGFDLHLGTLADVQSVTVESRTIQTREGSTATLFVGLYLDTSGDGEFFRWEERTRGIEEWVGVGDDEEGVTLVDADGAFTIDDDTEVTLLAAGTNATFGALRAGDVDGITGETAAALYVGVVGGEGGPEEVVVDRVDVERS